MSVDPVTDAPKIAPMETASLEAWMESRAYRADQFDLGQLVAQKRSYVSVVLPTREVADTIGLIVRTCMKLADRGLLDEVIVVDAASRDGTGKIARNAGATVYDESSLMGGFGPALGKGDAMWRALSATSGDVVVYIDADSEDFTEKMVIGMVGPILLDDELALVKGAFRRPFKMGNRVVPDGGGRVTELTARPFLNIYVPELARFWQPLAGEIAARRSLLEMIPFPVGYGIEIAMMIDSLELVGIERMGQVDLGTRQNRHQSLRALSAMSYAVMIAAARRIFGPEHDGIRDSGQLLLPFGGEFEARSIPVIERPPFRELLEWSAAAHE